MLVIYFYALFAYIHTHSQGASWDRSVRKFKEPEKPPPAVTARARPHDIEGLHGSEGRFAVWSHHMGKY